MEVSMKQDEQRSADKRTPLIHVVGETRATILDLLSLGNEFYGLEMVRRSNGRLKRAIVYVHLHRMEQDGLISSRVDDDHADRGPPRRKYRITALGRRALAARVAAQIAYDATPVWAWQAS
jgi:PadR family transcriptional regulator, regulatory protein PadR